MINKFHTKLGPAWALMRPKQWIKNGFVFAPLLFTGSFLELTSVNATILAACYFSIAASIVYILNDLKDLAKDKQHIVKAKVRPLASGAISLNNAITLAVCLVLFLFSGFIFCPQAMPVICLYIAINLGYTYTLKNMPVVDIFIIAIGFVLRVYVGARVLDVPVSTWMFITTLSLALYLASLKRLQEMVLSGSQSRDVLKKYSEKTLEKYAALSATCALIFYSLFVALSRPALAITVPIVMFGLFRYWYIVDSNKSGESPTDALYEDFTLCLTVVVWVLSCVLILWTSK